MGSSSSSSTRDNIKWILLHFIAGGSIVSTFITLFYVFFDAPLVSLFIVIPFATYCIFKFFFFMKKEKLSKIDEVIVLLIGSIFPLMNYFLEVDICFLSMVLVYVLIFFAIWIYKNVFTEFIQFYINIFKLFEDLLKKLALTITFYISILFIFAGIYQMIDLYEPNSFKGMQDNFFDYIYFSTVTITTLGYGEITPHTELAKFFVMLESLLGIFLLSILIGLTISISINTTKNS